MMEGRLGWFILGLVAGAVLGYLARVIQGIREKVDEMDTPPSKRKKFSELRSRLAGFEMPQWVNNLAVFLVVCLTAFAAITSQKSSNKSNKNTEDLHTTAVCTTLYLTATIEALNARTTFTVQQSNANVTLQKSLSTLVTLSLRQPPLTQTEARKVVQHFADALKEFLKLSGNTSQKVTDNPYPKVSSFENCLNGK